MLLGKEKLWFYLFADQGSMIMQEGHKITELEIMIFSIILKSVEKA